MPRQSPGIFAARFCTKCGTRLRSPNHVCQPSSIDRFQREAAWNKRSAAAGKPEAGKK